MSQEGRIVRVPRDDRILTPLSLPCRAKRLRPDPSIRWLGQNLWSVGWGLTGINDSYASPDLGPLGFQALFSDPWMFREPSSTDTVRINWFIGRPGGQHAR